MSGTTILYKYLGLAARGLGIETRFGWHTYSTLVRSVGAEFKVSQELLYRSTIRSTLDVYTSKQNAQVAVMSSSSLLKEVGNRIGMPLSGICVREDCGGIRLGLPLRARISASKSRALIHHSETTEIAPSLARSVNRVRTARPVRIGDDAPRCWD